VERTDIDKAEVQGRSTQSSILLQLQKFIKNFRILFVCKATRVKEITISYDEAFRFNMTEYSIKTPDDGK